MSKKLLVVRIQELVVSSNGDYPGERPSRNDELGLKNNSLMASLKYPRSGAPQVVSIKQYDLVSGSPAHLLDERTPDEFFDNLLFREEVLDQTVLHLTITNFDATGKVVKFFLKLFSVIIGAGFTAASSGLTTVLGAVTGFGVDTMRAGVSGSGDDHVDRIGEARLPLSMDKLTEAPQSIRLELTAPETIIRRGYHMDPEHGVEDREIAVTTQGKANGHITLEILALPV